MTLNNYSSLSNNRMFWPSAAWLAAHRLKRHTGESGWGGYAGRAMARGVKNSCVATKYVCASECRDCKKQPRTNGGLQPKRIVGDLYSFPLIFHLREDLGERLKEFFLRDAGSV